MTKDEALKLALEALHGFIPYLPLNDEAQCGRYDKAITAIKEALAQPEHEPVACVVDGDLYFHHEIDWEDLAYQGHGVELLYTTSPPCQTCEAMARAVMMDQTGRDA